MSVRRKVPDAETARAWLDAAARSGLARAAWCAATGVDARSLQCWRLALDRRAARSASPFGEWVPRSDSPASARPAHAPLRVHVGDAIVEVPWGFMLNRWWTWYGCCDRPPIRARRPGGPSSRARGFRGCASRPDRGVDRGGGQVDGDRRAPGGDTEPPSAAPPRGRGGVASNSERVFAAIAQAQVAEVVAAHPKPSRLWSYPRDAAPGYEAAKTDGVADHRCNVLGS